MQLKFGVQVKTLAWKASQKLARLKTDRSSTVVTVLSVDHMYRSVIHYASLKLGAAAAQMYFLTLERLL